MLRNYLSAALHNLQRNRAYAAINVLVLAVGFAAAILIALYVRDEYSYDRFFPDHERIYKVDETLTLPGQPSMSASQTVSDMAQMLRLDFSQIEATARLVGSPILLRHGDIESRVVAAYWADPDFFRFFPLRALAGKLSSALSQPDGIVLTRKIALRLFGREDVVGETVELNHASLMHVTAVIADLPSNTHLTGDVFLPGIASFSELTRLDAVKRGTGAQKSFSVYTYVRLRAGAGVAPISAALDDFVRRHMTDEMAGVPISKVLRISLVPVAATHLQPRQVDALKPQGDPRTLHLMMTIAVLILVVAGANFVSMMTARAFHRAVEVGVRKSAGARRRQIFIQFMGESVLYAVGAMILAVAAVQVLMPAFNASLQRTITFDYAGDPAVAAGLIALVATMGLAAGAYPALVLSKLRPGLVLKGSTALPSGSGRMRQLLVVFQFATLVALVVATLAIDAQARYAIADRLRLPNAQIYWSSSGCPRPFAAAAVQVPGVRALTCASSVGLAQSHWGGAFSAPGGSPISIETAMIDYQYFDLFGVRPIAGRLLAPEHGEDDVLHAGDEVAANPAIVLNESAVRALGFTSAQAAIGQSRRWTRPQIAAGNPKSTDSMSSQIVGVVPDFSVGSIRDAIEPTAYYIDPEFTSYALVMKLDGRTIPETLSAIRALWAKQGRQPAFEGMFLSQYLGDLYSDIIEQTRLFTAFSSVAVVLAGLGLLGLALFTVERRTKEIGLRKVMGASRADILRFLGWEFARPVLWANLIAWPCAYFFIERWLQGFAYHVSLSVVTFIIAGALSLVIALSSVAAHALLISRAKPVEALRYE